MLKKNEEKTESFSRIETNIYNEEVNHAYTSTHRCKQMCKRAERSGMIWYLKM